MTVERESCDRLLTGDTVNVASRMESTGTAGRVQCSDATVDLLERIGESATNAVITELRGEVDVKGKGVMRTYWLMPKCT